MAVSQKKTPTISVIILNYNTDDLVLHLITTITHPDIEIIVVNNSETNSLEKKLPNNSNLQYFFMTKNLGFGGGVNYGSTKAKSEWLFFLNSDTTTSADDILKLLDITKKNNAIVSVPKLKSESTVENNVGLFNKITKNPVNLLFLRPHFIDCSKLNKPQLFDLATGGALVIKKDIFDSIGKFDDLNFFMYFEDIDLSYRLYKKHISILFIPNIVITHIGGKSSDDPLKKSLLYSKSLYAFLKKNRGLGVATVNRYLKFLK